METVVDSYSSQKSYNEITNKVLTLSQLNNIYNVV